MGCCGDANCKCLVIQGVGIQVTGIGSIPDPFVISRDTDSDTPMWFNVTDYGAGGGGDVTDEIHAAKVAAGVGGTVYFPKGEYTVDGLEADVARQLWYLDSGAVLKLKTGAISDVIQISADTVTILGGKVDGNRVGQAANRAGIRTWGAHNLVYEVEVTECYSHGITAEDPGSHARILNCYVHDNGVQANAIGGIYVNGAPYAHIEGNRCHDNGDYGTGDSTYDGDGIKVQGAVGDGQKAIITGNFCWHNARRGIKSQQTHAIITNNECWDNGGAGIGVVGGGPEGSTGVISNNILPGNFFGLQFDGAADWLIGHNQITDSRDHGMSVSTDTTRLVFDANLFARAQRHGAVCRNLKDSLFSNNLFIDNGQGGVETFGLQFDDGTTNCENISLIGNKSENSLGETTQTRGFVLSGTTDRIHMVGNVAVEGLSTPYSAAGGVTNVTGSGNLGFTLDSDFMAEVPHNTDGFLDLRAGDQVTNPTSWAASATGAVIIPFTLDDTDADTIFSVTVELYDSVNTGERSLLTASTYRNSSKTVHAAGTARLRSLTHYFGDASTVRTPTIQWRCNGGTDVWLVIGGTADSRPFQNAKVVEVTSAYSDGGRVQSVGQPYVSATLPTATSTASPDVMYSVDQLRGSGSPEGVAYSYVGQEYLDTATGTVYRKKTGNNTNTGWQITPTVLTNTASLNFGSINPGEQATLTITVTGAATGDSVHLGAPSGLEAGLSFSGYVSATNTVTVIVVNNTAGAIDPASATWRATVMKV